MFDQVWLRNLNSMIKCVHVYMCATSFLVHKTSGQPFLIRYTSGQDDVWPIKINQLINRNNFPLKQKHEIIANKSREKMGYITLNMEQTTYFK